jgi:hypothetical protein
MECDYASPFCRAVHLHRLRDFVRARQRAFTPLRQPGLLDPHHSPFSFHSLAFILTLPDGQNALVF